MCCQSQNNEMNFNNCVFMPGKKQFPQQIKQSKIKYSSKSIEQHLKSVTLLKDLEIAILSLTQSSFFMKYVVTHLPGKLRSHTK